MKHSSPIAWFEIVTQDLERAIKFYETAFDIKLERIEASNMKMALFPYDKAKGFTGGALVCSDCYADHQAGQGSTIIYLNTDSVSKQLATIMNLGGETALPAMSIGENGHIAGFKDSEGNFVGLWSMNP